MPRRGRPTKASQREILETGSEPIAREFRLRPLRTPVDVQFAPYYGKVLKGDLSAIGDYVDSNATQKELDPSFYELLGRLLTIRFYPAANHVLSDVERRGSIGFPANKDVQAYWYWRLLPFCKRARQFISGTSRPDSDENREALWRNYVLQPLSTVRYASLVGKADEGKLQEEANLRDQQQRTVAGEELLAWSESHTLESVRSRLESLECPACDLEALAQSRFYQERVQRFQPYRLVPREIFFDLLSTQRRSVRRAFVSTPAAIARRYACRIADISEGTVSHKTVRKTID